jgi:hypothetical protein
MPKCEHGLTSKECYVCASPKHGAEPVEPVACIDALKDAFFEGFTSVATYNDTLLNSPEEAWEKYKPPHTAPPQRAEPTLQTCNCRWDGEVQVQQCTLHEAHVDAIHEWAERAKTAEKKLAALAQQAEPVAVAERERIAAQWDGCVTHQLDIFGPVDIGASIRAGELVGPAQQAEPVQEPAYKVKVAGRWHDTEPLAPAFSLPDGEHLLYTAPPQRKQSEQAEPVSADPHTTTLRNLLECCLSWEPDACVLGNVTARQAVAALRAALAQEQAEPLTIERLRYALVASRIIPPEAVEDPDEYDDGVTLHRIEALHRRIA